MKKNISWFFCLVLLTVVAPSCKKETTVSSAYGGTTTSSAHLATLGLYQYASGVNKRIFIPITKVGTQAISYLSIFDTGSAGMTIDASGILPASMITSTGIIVTGDSVVVNGITVTSKTSVMSYGDNTGITKEYGNLAYAPVTIGDNNGSITTKRIPIFLYYKKIDGTGTQAAPHSGDVFGVGPGTSYANSAIASPLSYFTTGTGVTSGFRLALLNNNYFTSNVTYVAGLLTLGLLESDLSSSGFIMHPLSYTTSGGYSPNIPATITYSGKSTAAQVLFDTGTPSVTIIEDKAAASTAGALPVNTAVTVTTNKGFTYTYLTSSTSNLTSVENPNVTGDYRTIFSLDFFIKNEFLTDYSNHQIGLKNN